MKKGKFGSCWHPLMGVVAVGALALGVSALAAPRPVDDSAVRGTNKGKTEVTRLVTGDPAQINAVVAGTPPTAVLAITPVPAKPAAGPVDPPGVSLTYPGGTTIAGQTITADSGGFRAFFDVTVKDWDNNGDGVPGSHTVQVKVDAAGYLGLNASPSNPGVDLKPPDAIVCGVVGTCVAGSCAAGSAIGESCTVNADCNGPRRCRDNFGENWAKCELGFCKAGYVENTGTQRTTDNYCTPDGCNQGDVDTSSVFYRWFDIHNLPNRLDNNDPAVNGVFYIGSLGLDIPAAAKGTYTVGLVPAETFISDSDSIVIDTLQENGFVVHIVTGSCCFNLGTGTSGCVDNQTRGECETGANAPFFFTPGGTCLNPPTSEGCKQCLTPGLGDPLCDDNDACTDDVCTAIFTCTHPPISGFDPNKPAGTNCCDSATGGLTLKDDGIPCTQNLCSEDGVNASPDNRGTPFNPPFAVTQPCVDGNPCTVNDHCNGSLPALCIGDSVNDKTCTTASDCPLDPAGNNYACVDGKCFCTLKPDISFEIPVGDPKTCDGGPRDGLPCQRDVDCEPLGVCNLFGPHTNCFDEGEKVTAVVHIGSAGAAINGGQFLIKLNLGGCMEFESITCLAPYTQTVYGPIVNVAAGTIFIACGVDPFGDTNGPLGSVDMLSLSFTKIGACADCELCFGTVSDNPYNTYLVDDAGQRVEVNGDVCKGVRARGDLILDVPDNIKTNADCDGPTAVETWDPPTATFSCGAATLTCRGQHELGLVYGVTCEGGTRNTLPCGSPVNCPGGTCVDKVMNGGTFAQGASSFCCYASVNDECGQFAGCPGSAHDCGSQLGKPEGCWTVQVNDETSLDVDVQLGPPITHNDRDGVLTRCIKFCLFADSTQEPICYDEDVTFGGMFNFVGKSRGKIKVSGGSQWGCITAQDQQHTLRSCYVFGAGDCAGGQLHAQFSGDPAFGGNGHWLIGGNLDGWKKVTVKQCSGSGAACTVTADCPAGQTCIDVVTNPDGASLDVIDILDFGMFVSQFGVTYADNDTPCPADSPNADINGDGTVNSADYNFIVASFLLSSKGCCGGPQSASMPTPLVEVSVDELQQLGMGELAVADLNGDGLVNAQDMDAFMQGARPTKTSNDRKGGKGLRSGR